MATNNDKTVEPCRTESTSSVTTSPAPSTNSPKVSIFTAKSGFVIPKNKLSGSLVPIFRGGRKGEAGDSNKEETPKQTQRKTKWGSDLTQDGYVRKGRALAYQIRVEQITKQLNCLETEDDQDFKSPKENINADTSSYEKDNEKSKMSEVLKLEKREIIGEILHLNPSYKPPADYKPLMKVAKVPIPIKAYEGHNFVRLLLGPESKTQKRLEEETGAKIQVYGTKVDTKEKSEIISSDVTEARGTYEELHVSVSADTFEKVDAAVALIELLLTPVAGNATVASTNSSDPNKDMQGTQTIPVLAQSGPGHFQQYPRSWYQATAPTNVPLSSSGFTTPPMPSNNIPTSSVTHNNPPLFGQQSPFGAYLTPPNVRSVIPQQYMPSSQPTPTGIVPAIRPIPVPFNPHVPRQVPLRNSPVWPERINVAQVGPPPSLPVITPRPPLVPQAVLQTPRNAPGATPAAMFSPQASFSSQTYLPQSGTIPAPPSSTGPLPSPVRPPHVPSFFGGPNPLGPSSPLTRTSSMAVPQIRITSPAPGPMAAPSVRPPTINQIAPPILRPSSSDFTFQPLGAKLSVSRSAPHPTVPQAASFLPPAFQGPSMPAPPVSIPRPPSFANLHATPNISGHIRPNVSGSMGVRPSNLMPPPMGDVNMTGSITNPRAPNHFYDPFSPTSISASASQRGGDTKKTGKSESDAEYEDLMASMGVR